MKSFYATAPLVLVLLSGCVVGPDHAAPAITLPAKFAEGPTSSNSDVSMAAWWTAFNDSRLNGYVEQGLA